MKWPLSSVCTFILQAEEIASSMLEGGGMRLQILDDYAESPEREKKAAELLIEVRNRAELRRALANLENTFAFA